MLKSTHSPIYRNFNLNRGHCLGIWRFCARFKEISKEVVSGKAPFSTSSLSQLHRSFFRLCRFKTQTKLPAMKAIELTPGQFSIPRQKICDITALSNTSPRGINVKERLTTVTLSHEKFSSSSESLSSILPIHERYETSYCLPFFTITVMSFEMFCL